MPLNSRPIAFGFLLAALAAPILCRSEDKPTAPKSAGKVGEWPVYGGDKASSKYSPLDQINKTNVKSLRIVWRWKSPDDPILKARKLETWLNEGTPLMVDGVLYVSTSLSQVAAINAATGKTLWVYDPKSYEAGTPTNLGFTHRGVAYWTDGMQQRLFIGTCDSYLIALDARTGKVISEFGEGGKIDLTKGLGREVPRSIPGVPIKLYAVSSPPILCRDTVIVGSSILDFPIIPAMPPGDVRGFDARTGEQRWAFHVIPREGETGTETWEGDSWKNGGAANVWTTMSADDDLGYVYLPCSTPSNDFYGGNRPGDGLFGESLVCLDARTGKRVWHYQIVHHGVWDYDLPAAPNLVDITVGGKKIKAVAQVTKHGFCFVFDRITGKPVWPIEERPVPQSSASGEKTSPTQPFPTKPAPFDRQGVKEEDLIAFTPELRKEATAFVNKYDHGALFTPPSAKGTINLPGWGGGANWAGAAFDPETGLLYVPSITAPIVVTLTKASGFIAHARTFGAVTPLVDTPSGLPLFKPPYGRITAIDLNTGNHAWMIPFGEGPRHHPKLKGMKLPRLGWDRRGFVLVTKTLLFAGQEAGQIRRSDTPSQGHTLNVDFMKDDPKFCAFDKRTGKLLCEIALPANESGTPMTYMLNGKQVILIPVGGGDKPAELVALGLP